MKGWMLDAYPNHRKRKMVVWLKTNDGAKRILCDFSPRFYVRSRSDDYKRVLETFRDEAGFDCRFKNMRTSLLSEKKRKVLEVDPGCLENVMRRVRALDSLTSYGDLEFFNADIDPGQRFLMENGLFPLAKVRFSQGRFVILDEREALDYEVPPLKVSALGAKAEGSGVSSRENPLEKAWLDEETFQGNDVEILSALKSAVLSKDPDVLLCEGGDSFVLPYLYRRAELCGAVFHLGRIRHGWSPALPERSYMTYGQMVYRPASYNIPGRIHVDSESSFLYKAGGLSGIIDLARISGIPLQRQVRASPGTAISAMQVNQAMRDGVLVMWKKNVPEAFKTMRELMLADRGGFIFEPETGLHESVLELDFVSMYPSIMVRHNLSPETVKCRCCPESEKRVPELGYRICEKKEGLLPRILDPVVARRIEYKRMSREKGDEYSQRSDVLKWLLVTCFGYTGYKNARFGRIECHESITAYGREILVDTSIMAEEMGFRVLHGIVDSLWLKGPLDKKGELAEKTEARLGIPLGEEGVYKWIVFLPSRVPGLGALNRYYGVFENGEMKLRGIFLRRRDTPPLFKKMQGEMLSILAEGDDAQGFLDRIPAALELARWYHRIIHSGKADPVEMVMTKRATRAVSGYSVFTTTKAALMQAEANGEKVSPGQNVRFIVTDSTSKDFSRRVSIEPMLEGGESYDRNYYISYHAKSVENLLAPWYGEEEIKRLMRNGGAVLDPSGLEGQGHEAPVRY